MVSTINRGVTTMAKKVTSSGNPLSLVISNPEQHVCLSPWPPCWKCKRLLGCNRCKAKAADEVLCWDCGIWATLEALLYHGPLPLASLLVYPQRWVAAYKRKSIDLPKGQGVEQSVFSIMATWSNRKGDVSSARPGAGCFITDGREERHHNANEN